MKAKAATGEVIDLTFERTLKENLQRQLLEIEIAIERGELVLSQPIEDRAINKVMAMKAEYLAMPEKIRHLMSTEYDAEINVEYLDEVIYQALTAISETDITEFMATVLNEITPAI